MIGYRFISDMERFVPRQGIDDFYIEIVGIAVQPVGKPMGKYNLMIRLSKNIPNYIGKALDSTMKMMGRGVFRKSADLLINSIKEDIREKVMEFTGGKGAGLVCKAAGSGATEDLPLSV